MCLYEKGRDALAAVLDVALHEQEGPVALPRICQRTGLDLAFLEDIFRKLLDHGIVATTCGPGCGYMLLQPAEDLTAAEVVLAVEDATLGGAPRCRKGTCRTPSHDAAQLAADDLWSGLDASLIGYLSTITIKDMACCNAARPCRARTH